MRSVTVALVIGGHIGLIVLLVSRGVDELPSPADDRMNAIFIELPPDTPGADAPEPASRVSHIHHFRAPPPVTADLPAIVDPTAITPDIDWFGDASSAASREAAKPAVRGFGFPKREPAPKEKKEFGWDKTHTERVSALPEGGMLIRLNDNCAIILAPLPLGGCSLGKRSARGDLFDEMKDPGEPGDWK